MDEKSLTEIDCFLQPGGAVEISYKGFAILAPRNEVIQMLTELRSMQVAKRRRTLRSVNRALQSAMRKKDLTQRQAMRMAQDVAIWFANEVVDGRAKL